jgi:hypothetical protein
MRQFILAGVAYFGCVFTAGFALEWCGPFQSWRYWA